VYGPSNELLYSIERSASALFGIVTYGVHMTCYTRVEGASYGIKMWTPRRAKTKQTYPSMLDNAVAGGMATTEVPLECVIREANEEASLPAELVREKAEAQGTITYTYIRDDRAGGETGLIQPEVQYVYDLELPEGVVCKPNDSEVEEFYLWTVEEVQDAMGRGEFKPNCALLVLDFFIRWGILTEENEENYNEIKKRLHRNLDFPGPFKTA
jgi:isopentenyldiphosphate isomerase